MTTKSSSKINACLNCELDRYGTFCKLVALGAMLKGVCSDTDSALTEHASFGIELILRDIAYEVAPEQDKRQRV